jgi:large subunit ribosomal protein L13
LKDFFVSLAQRLTYSYKQNEIERKWYLVDASDQTLGRVASRVAHLLRGKHKPNFTPNIDGGDFVVVVNADKVKVTGKRPALKEYFHYTGYPGGATWESFRELIKQHPEKVFLNAVKGMIPHNRLGQRMILKLKVYAGPDHPHKAQKPEPVKL